MNKVILIGNLTRDPELRTTNNGVNVCGFSIAVNRPYTTASGERQTDYFNCSAWRGLGETVVKYCKKGHRVAVEGSVETRSFEDSQGVKRTAVEVVASSVEFLTPASKGEGTGGDGAKPALQAFDDDGDIPF